MPSGGLSNQDFQVGDWLVQPRLARIQRGDRSVHVTPRAMAVLIRLAEAGGAVLSRNELLDAVWPRLNVTPDALSRCLVELRKAFGDDMSAHRILETIPKVGVRLTAPIVALDTGNDETATAKRSRLHGLPLWAIQATALLVVGAAVGAALLWTSRSNEPVSAEIATSSALARDFYLSANDYSRRPNRLEALKHQEELYRRATVEDPQFASAWAHLGRTHTGIYWYGVDRSVERLTLAEEALRRALQLRPDLPEGHLYLADYYFKGRHDAVATLAEFAIAERAAPADPELHFLRSAVYRRVGQWDRAVGDGERAVELDSRNLVYRRQLQVTYLFMRDYARADRALDDMLRLAPDDGTTYVDKTVIALASSGDTELARRYAAVAPTTSYADGLGYTYTRWLTAIFDRDYTAAARTLAEAPGEEIFNGDLRPSTIPKAVLHARTVQLAGNLEGARAEFQAVAAALEGRLAASPSNDAVATSALQMTLAEAQAGAGERAAALVSMRAARSLAPKSKDALYGSAMQLAGLLRVLIPAGETDVAVQELADYLDGPGHWAVEGLVADPRLDPLRSDPRFAASVEKHRRR